jgi:hypothetical protein
MEPDVQGGHFIGDWGVVCFDANANAVARITSVWVIYGK